MWMSVGVAKKVSVNNNIMVLSGIFLVIFGISVCA